MALERIRQRVEFIANIFANNIQVQPGTPAAAHQEFFPTTNVTLNQGSEAQKNVEASVSLLNESVYVYYHDSALTDSLDSLAHRRNVSALSLYYRYYSLLQKYY